MGASGWTYWVPYEPDVAAALVKLRERVFTEGRYYQGRGDHKVKSPTSIADLFHQMDELELSTEGTHSILDMNAIGEAPGFGLVCPLTEDQIDALFETTKPRRAQIEAEKSLLSDLRQRWEGTYVIAYEGDVPSEILFIGFSGD